MCIVGPTLSGKTWFITKLIDNSKTVFDTLPRYVYWFYGIKTELHDLLVNKKYVMIQGLPTNFDFIEPNSIVVIDDLMNSADKHKEVTNLFLQHAHHKKLFVIFVMQNLFHQSQESRDRVLNCHYLVLFRNWRDMKQISWLSQQIYPHKKNYLVDIFNDATNEGDHPYLFIDSYPTTPSFLRLRTNYLPDKPPMFAYVDKHIALGMNPKEYLKL